MKGVWLGVLFVFQETAASSMWHQYQALTSGLSQQLCEQLRLVLEPSQATKLKSVQRRVLTFCVWFYCRLCESIQMYASNSYVFCFICVLGDLLLRGDYRTGKRLNMRKVIPYIASQFRKDKIWLRRTKPSKREYQICLAIDDSSSMVDNHSKQVTLILLFTSSYSTCLNNCFKNPPTTQQIILQKNIFDKFFSKWLPIFHQWFYIIQDESLQSLSERFLVCGRSLLKMWLIGLTMGGAWRSHNNLVGWTLGSWGDSHNLSQEGASH